MKFWITQLENFNHIFEGLIIRLLHNCMSLISLLLVCLITFVRFPLIIFIKRIVIMLIIIKTIITLFVRMVVWFILLLRSTIVWQHWKLIYTCKQILYAWIIQHLELFSHPFIRQTHNKTMYNFIMTPLCTNCGSLYSISKLLNCFFAILKQSIKNNSFWHCRLAKTLKQE
mgnify:CR=1 FL=1